MLLQNNDRYDYVVNGVLVVFKAHKHNKPFGSEAVGSNCAGCIDVPDKAIVDVKFKNGTLKEERVVDGIDLKAR